ncbi:patatin-like phospholipase family protein [Streptacidiphilus neutrinimicus]|uniref:patatin-like phospholipase family protein n=1 Tax=Streptacidiphilus neutrinimicus TaxID=105420 RepID=UPI000A0016D9|nr:patatin-like phospholipase family protein [Streptacidiphilus neutrinimicus]
MAGRTADRGEQGTFDAPPGPAAPRRGLVIGGGGSLGAAWAVGALCALEDATGWDPRGADVILGTSAGAIVGSLLAVGASATELLDHQRGLAEVAGPVGGVRLDYDTWVGGALPRIPRPGFGSLRLLLDLVEHPHRMPLTTVLAAAAPPGRGSLGGVRDLFHQLRMDDHWPDTPALRVVAVDLDTGTRVLFGTPGAPPTDLGSAVTASCALPSWFEPVRIDGRRYVDGCAWSDTNVDLVAGEPLDEVYVLAPTCARETDHPHSIPARVERRLRRGSTARLLREAREVRDAGTQVHVLVPGPEDLAAMGANLMAPQHRLTVLETSLRTTKAALSAAEHG